jgi:hypothetical protein
MPLLSIAGSWLLAAFVLAARLAIGNPVCEFEDERCYSGRVGDANYTFVVGLLDLDSSYSLVHKLLAKFDL